MRFRPRRFPYNSIIIDGHSGYVSLQAFHWLSRNKVPVFVMNYDGTIISSILPPASIKANLRAAQIQASSNPKKKFRIAHAFVSAKIQRSLDILEWLSQHYDIEKAVRLTKHEALKLPKSSTVGQLRTVEGRVEREQARPESRLKKNSVNATHFGKTLEEPTVHYGIHRNEQDQVER